MSKIEIRCKGTFAYLRGKNASRTLAVSRGKPRHHVHLFVRKRWVPRKYYRFFDGNTPDKIGDELCEFLRFTESLASVSIDGQRFAPAKDGATRPIPSNGAPNGDADLDESWTSAGFIPSFRRLNLPQAEPIADISKASFRMSLPPETQWYGLRPWQYLERLHRWRFVKPLVGGDDVIPRQAITDVVGIRLAVPAAMAITLVTGRGRKRTITLNFGKHKDLIDRTGFPVALISAPRHKSHGQPTAKEQAQATHFEQLYNFFSSDFEGTPEKFVVPVPPEDVVVEGDDIFCPGGEGEGGDP